MDEFMDFPIDFHIEPEIGELKEDNLYVEAEEQLRSLAQNHTDISKAEIAIDMPAEGRSTDFIYRARVTIHARPNVVNAVEKHSDIGTALRGALRAAVRQVREQRDRLRNHS